MFFFCVDCVVVWFCFNSSVNFAKHFCWLVIRLGSNEGREPGSRRLTVRLRKRKISCPFAMPYSDGAVSPIRSGPKVPKKKKKIKGNGQKLKKNQLNVRVNSGQNCEVKIPGQNCEVKIPGQNCQHQCLFFLTCLNWVAIYIHTS